MTHSTHEQMHHEHHRWQTETAMWREDIARWRDEHRQRLAALQSAFDEHTSALEQHAEALAQQEEASVHHEHFIRELLESGRPGAGEIEQSWEEVHEEQRTRHNLHQQAHERIKRHHYKAMARLDVLIAAMKMPE
ncbi:MAG: hypothetical protein ACF8PG_05980 [Maioricimonas sp. JB045]|uniref:hypothetical protein n=1 Tax=Maioricimonas sp. JC845 TaxID=3232138 RepID=UPI0034584303